jgi:anti-anti-sigma factor
MSDSIDMAASHFVPRHVKPAFACGGAEVRAQCRHLADVVTISGVIDTMNVDLVSAYSRNFILPDRPFVLDLTAVEYLAAQGIRFLYCVDDDCRAAGVQWALIAGPVIDRVLRITNDENVFPTADSVRGALHCFADAISARRRMLLSLLTKTA